VSLDVVRARVAFRDRPFADVLDLALRFCAVHGLRYAQVAGATTLPLLLLTLGAAYLAGPVVGWLVAIPLAIAAQLPFTVLASRLVFQDDVAVKGVLKTTLREAPRAMFLHVLTLGATVASAIIVLGPVVFAVMFLFASEVMLLERASVGTALGRSRRVAGSSIGDALLALLALLLIPACTVVLAEVGGRALMTELLEIKPPPSLFAEGWSILAFVGFFWLVPYVATARFFVYLNVRTRTEGWDIQTKFAAIAARAQQRDTRAEAA